MAYAGSTRRGRGATEEWTDEPVTSRRRGRRPATGARARGMAAGVAELDEAPRPRGRPFSQDVDWARLGAVGSGLAVGALLGAGVALLLAPQSGRATRRSLRRASLQARTRAADTWADLGDELSYRQRRAARTFRRRLARGRLRAEAMRDWVDPDARRWA